MFRIKICGVCRVADAEAAVEAGADAVGLNFYAPSPRAIDESTAAAIVERLPPDVARVGVFVREPARGVLRLAERLRLSAVQLHGEPSPDLLAELPGLAVIVAVRLDPERRDGLQALLDDCLAGPAAPAGLLVDAYHPRAYGGTGQLADWRLAAELRARVAPLPLILAGGLQADNVAAAIGAVEPAGVDTASGVESAPGRKCPVKMRQFVAAARAAFADRGR